MSRMEHLHPHRLPPLTLPPRQLKKAYTSCKKWLARFVSTAALAAGSEVVDGDSFSVLAASLLPPHEHATGFVALNGGTLAGCTPYDLRQTLRAHGLLSFAAAAAPPRCSCSSDMPSSGTPAPSSCVMTYGPTLAFVVCRVPLQVPSNAVACTDKGAGISSFSISVMHVSMAELAHFATSSRGVSASPSEAGLQDEEAPPMGALAGISPGFSPAVDGAATNSTSVKVVVLQVPPTASLWKAGSASTSSSSAKKGCSFLYLVSCDVAAVCSRVAHLFQRPVVGIESLLLPAPPLMCSAAKEEQGALGCSISTRPGQSLSNGEPLLGRRCTSRAVPDVPGLFLVEEFVTAEEEKIIWQELNHGRQQLQLEYLARRRVAHFNRRFLYGVNALTAEGVLVNARPSFYTWMRARLQNDAVAGGVRIDGDYPFRPGDYECDQLTVNYYDYSELGVCGIAAHVDAHSAFDDTVLIVSLGSYTVMEFARWDAPAGVTAPVGVYLAPRSLAVMTGEARYGWTHCIAERRTDTLSELLPTFNRGDRLSLTWRRGRTVRHTQTECPYPALCDGE
ncbi:conserved hypothetical protein [Leishmania braziliensis MHOM/BR/75/M2904]|uniref:Fe2OG dioxygenase domain-containing protein n=2 Tax=Leishmania braziliensis TaxID=5660 RepID=A4HEP6_LEIBR|nr:conserved hypothetical protein [Leishmania braziliensis MHOM/BR/75/M2904]CAJ2474538.1 unnamed protein product [Leishmania braziliensis]CAJ2475043.1 unnamed protein product [Leishmania braziliensis]CAM39304.2 conserved hypothetical protein [Leishmania braziliensis MHOM/BR/75/M2904]SYZ66704.1 2OG-Fe(II)_oxygenase_superfamily [Leishmania braziliensis MHOM/BR/75/M2904]